MGRRDATEAETNAEKIRGPVGKMIRGAVAHMNEPNELVEEVMYEHILMTRMRLNKGLPFVAVCASSAPLLGLLGTVTGIINTFKLITAFGSGDVKMLSGGISEALVTTEFGLIVAIPSLLFHTFLNRRAKSLIDRMEKVAVSVMNQLNKKPMQNDAQTGTATPAKPDAPTAAPEAPAGEVTESPEAEPVKEEQPVVSAMADNDVNAPADAVGNDTEDPERQPVTVCTSDYNTNGKDNGNGHHKHDGQDRGRPQNN
jgi:biopolymer transport protein ExbB/TolQ